MAVINNSISILRQIELLLYALSHAMKAEPQERFCAKKIVKFISTKRNKIAAKLKLLLKLAAEWRVLTGEILRLRVTRLRQTASNPDVIRITSDVIAHPLSDVIALLLLLLLFRFH